MDFTARFSALVQGPEDRIPLDEAALLIAAHAHPELNIAAEMAVLDELAQSCPGSTLDAWRRYLFVELGFSGNVGDYYDPDNSFLPQVVRRRMGLPIALSALGIEVGRRLGLDLRGIGMPGHFLLRGPGGIGAGGHDVYVDPFDGGAVIDRDGCVRRFHAVNGNDVPFDPAYLEPVGTRAILGRMLANLKSIYTRKADLDALRWVLGLRLSIPGTPPSERHELALVLASLGRFSEAADQVEELAAELPQDADTLHAEAESFRARLN